MARSLETLIKIIKDLPDIKQRGVAAIIGAAVADAATRPFHWVYNQQQLDSILGDTKTPEFWPESKSPFYTIQLGERSTYNETAYVSLLALKESKGSIDINGIGEAIKKHFGEGTAYQEAYRRRSKDNLPNAGPWIHGAVTNFLEKYCPSKPGPFGDPENKELDGFCLSIPLIALNHSTTDVWKIISPVVTLLSTNVTATEIFHVLTLVLNNFVHGDENPFITFKEEIKGFYPGISSLLDEVNSNQAKPYKEMVAHYGKACSLPGSFVGAYLAMLNTNSYVDAVRLNITAGGCNCSRSNIIGSCFGAKYGIDGIPIEWMKKVNNIENIMELAIEIITS